MKDAITEICERVIGIKGLFTWILNAEFGEGVIADIELTTYAVGRKTFFILLLSKNSSNRTKK